MVMALAGNKCDLEDKRSVTAEVSSVFYLDAFIFSNMDSPSYQFIVVLYVISFFLHDSS